MSVDAANSPANRLYQKLGYEVTIIREKRKISEKKRKERFREKEHCSIELWFSAASLEAERMVMTV